ncbi:hypothetical protein PVT71_11685 [Salipiger sp. H15]|uniref:Uncharacterized protein n=1 Tax=Alloyangia sp. H15 TaxID=3029062 RepID=A0AAU8AF22_9RHOB
MTHEIGYSAATPARGSRAEVLHMILGAFWPAEGALDALLDRIEMTRAGVQARSVRGVK